MIYDLQRASLTKRLSAAIFDFILIAVLVVGIASLLSLVLKYDKHVKDYETRSQAYYEEFGLDPDMTQAKYEAMTREEQRAYDVKVRAADAKAAKDTEYQRVYNLVINLTLIISTFSILISQLIWEFILPLVFKNGQTLGKKIFGIAIMRNNGVKVNSVVMLIRTLLGKFTIETMFPVLLLIMMYFGSLGALGVIILIALLLLQIILVLATKTKTPIHDLLAMTVAVDMQSQLIFDTEEALIEYKKKVAEEAAEEWGKRY